MKANKDSIYFQLQYWGKNSAKILFVGALLMLLYSCGQNAFNSKKELMAHLQDPENGYFQKKEVNGLTYTIMYRPTDLLVQQEINGGMTEQELDSLRNKYNKYLYFNLSLAKNGKEILDDVSSSRAAFGEMVNQLAFGMGEKTHLISQTRDTIGLLDYIYPREYGMGGATIMMFVYPRDKKLLEKDFFNITIEDIGLKTGEISFKIASKAIKKEPKLKFDI